MRIGTFNPEGLWRDPHTATLPTLNLPKSNQEIERLDELLFPWRGEAAAFLTRYKMDSSHLDYLKRLKPAVAYSYIQHDATIRLDDHDFYRLVGENLYPTSHRTYTFRPYAITRPFVDLVRLHGVDWSFPPLSAVEMVNSKTFSTEASELVEDQSFGTVVRSIQELTRFLRASEQSALLVKDPFGVSGAGQILIRDRSTAHRLVQHLEDQISLGQRIELIVEPYTPFQKEFGCYYLIERDGAISLQGLRMTHNRGFS